VNTSATSAVTPPTSVVLLVAGAGVLPRVPASTVVAAALALLVWSFARDVRWLWRVRPAGRAVRRPVRLGGVGASRT
jgi:hypothetical protein